MIGKTPKKKKKDISNLWGVGKQIILESLAEGGEWGAGMAGGDVEELVEQLRP